MAITGTGEKTKTHAIQSDLNLYQSLYAISEKIMMAAKREAWNDLITHEIKHQEIYYRLKKLSGNQLLRERDMERKANLIKKILKVDKQTQRLIKNRMKKLQKGVEEERKITQAYTAVTQLES